MDHTSATIFFNPLEQRKILHLLRHAQGIHNVEAEKSKEATLSPQLLDAQLSPLGWQQVENLRKEVRSNGLFERVELVVTSPMSRTIQTAIGVFGEEIKGNQVGENKQDSRDHNSLPIIAIELCRERMGINPCDKRRSISNYQSLFPLIDFSQIESDDDILWKADSREGLLEVAARGMKLMKWLRTRKEKEIAIVSHGIFLQQTLLAFKNEFDELCQRFGNCELRSVTITDQGAIAKIPRGLTLQENTLEKKIPRGLALQENTLEKKIPTCRELAPNENTLEKKIPTRLSLSVHIRQP
ncbi:phosphoglycerate mutase-like protein [Carica papaya]|uniref:phosphoglycerate mutase-like protein n=1 Tax=Carica papaya TaxID=3649 RepID=UPI000B8C9540|nr:phosphoglycerate mutase-like protein [Carica papaya]